MANSPTTAEVGNGIYPYKPSQTAGMMMAVLFGMSAAYHLIIMIKKRTWFYTPLTIGAISKSCPLQTLRLDNHRHI
jgi:hypothetical protein